MWKLLHSEKGGQINKNQKWAKNELNTQILCCPSTINAKSISRKNMDGFGINAPLPIHPKCKLFWSFSTDQAQVWPFASLRPKGGSQGRSWAGGGENVPDSKNLKFLEFAKNENSRIKIEEWWKLVDFVSFFLKASYVGNKMRWKLIS